MRNKFTRFVGAVVLFLALLAFGFARVVAADAVTSDGVTEAARSGEGIVAASPGDSQVAAASPLAARAELPTAEASVANQAPMQAFLALLIPLAIAFFRSRVDIPDRYRKWIPVVAPVLGELVAWLGTNMPHGSGALAGLAAVGLREVKDQHFPGTEPAKAGTTNPLASIAIAFGLLLFCGTLEGCAHLNQAGIYHGDKVAYDADAVIDGAYTALDEFVQWEKANHVVIAQKWPEVSAFAALLESGEGDHWIDDALDMRDAYAGNPSEANHTKLQRALSVLTTGLAKVAVYQARLVSPPK